MKDLGLSEKKKFETNFWNFFFNFGNKFEKIEIKNFEKIGKKNLEKLE